jgi:hypothetical protein
MEIQMMVMDVTLLDKSKLDGLDQEEVQLRLTHVLQHEDLEKL